MIQKVLVFNVIFLCALMKCEKYEKFKQRMNEGREMVSLEGRQSKTDMDLRTITGARGNGESQPQKERSRKFTPWLGRTVSSKEAKNRQRRDSNDCKEGEVDIQGSCVRILTQGPCTNGTWITLDRETRKPRCTARPSECDTTQKELSIKCARAVLKEQKETNPALYNFTCNPAQGQTLAFTETGDIVCDCQMGHILWKDGSCQKPFTRGPCQKRQYLDIRRLTDDSESGEDESGEYGIDLRAVGPVHVQNRKVKRENQFFSISQWKGTYTKNSEPHVVPTTEPVSATESSTSGFFNILEFLERIRGRNTTTHEEEAQFEAKCAENPCEPGQFPIYRSQQTKIKNAVPPGEDDDEILFSDDYTTSNTKNVCAAFDTKSICLDSHILDLDLLTFQLKCVTGGVNTRHFGASVRMITCGAGETRVHGSCRRLVRATGPYRARTKT